MSAAQSPKLSLPHHRLASLPVVRAANRRLVQCLTESENAASASTAPAAAGTPNTVRDDSAAGYSASRSASVHRARAVRASLELEYQSSRDFWNGLKMGDTRAMNALTLAAFISMLILAFIALSWDLSRERG